MNKDSPGAGFHLDEVALNFSKATVSSAAAAAAGCADYLTLHCTPPKTNITSILKSISSVITPSYHQVFLNGLICLLLFGFM